MRAFTGTSLPTKYAAAFGLKKKYKQGSQIPAATTSAKSLSRKVVPKDRCSGLAVFGWASDPDIFLNPIFILSATTVITNRPGALRNRRVRSDTQLLFRLGWFIWFGYWGFVWLFGCGFGEDFVHSGLIILRRSFRELLVVDEYGRCAPDIVSSRFGQVGFDHFVDLCIVGHQFVEFGKVKLQLLGIAADRGHIELLGVGDYHIVHFPECVDALGAVGEFGGGVDRGGLLVETQRKVFEDESNLAGIIVHDLLYLGPLTNTEWTLEIAKFDYCDWRIIRAENRRLAYFYIHGNGGLGRAVFEGLADVAAVRRDYVLYIPRRVRLEFPKIAMAAEVENPASVDCRRRFIALGDGVLGNQADQRRPVGEGCVVFVRSNKNLVGSLQASQIEIVDFDQVNPVGRRRIGDVFLRVRRELAHVGVAAEVIEFAFVNGGWCFVLFREGFTGDKAYHFRLVVDQRVYGGRRHQDLVDGSQPDSILPDNCADERSVGRRCYDGVSARVGMELSHVVLAAEVVYPFDQPDTVTDMVDDPSSWGPKYFNSDLLIFSAKLVSAITSAELSRVFYEKRDCEKAFQKLNGAAWSLCATRIKSESNQIGDFVPYLPHTLESFSVQEAANLFEELKRHSKDVQDWDSIRVYCDVMQYLGYNDLYDWLSDITDSNNDTCGVVEYWGKGTTYAEVQMSLMTSPVPLLTYDAKEKTDTLVRLKRDFFPSTWESMSRQSQELLVDAEVEWIHNRLDNMIKDLRPMLESELLADFPFIQHVITMNDPRLISTRIRDELEKPAVRSAIDSLNLDSGDKQWLKDRLRRILHDLTDTRNFFEKEQVKHERESDKYRQMAAKATAIHHLLLGIGCESALRRIMKIKKDIQTI